MRILEICNHFPPTTGGSETHNFSIVKYLHQQCHDVEVIAVRGLQDYELSSYENIRNSILSDEFVHPELPGVHIHNVILKKYKFPDNYICYYNIWKKIRQIEKERGRFDLIEIHFLPLALILSSKRKIALAIHSFTVVCVKYHSPAQCHRPDTGRCRCVGLIRYVYWRLINVICMHKVDKIIVKYDYMGRNIAKRKVPKNKIATIPHWINYENFQGAMAQKKSDKPEIFTYGFLGRLDEFKGIGLIIQAFKIILDKKIKARMLIIGDGFLKKELEDFCRQNSMLEYVNFVGSIDKDQLSNYLSLADAFVVGSPYDNYNWSLLELMCSGKPIIATNTGGTCDILIDGYNSILADPTPHSIAEKMEYVLKNYDFVDKISENAMKTVKEKHSMDNLKLYESLLTLMLTHSHD
jgi:glycosyltransferase involved in cell wall biosynthesis